jgi:act minimal PKS acyl carrier protein
MNSLALEDLRVIMRSCIGDEPSPHLDGDILDKTFVDLHIDSLAVLEVAARLQDTYRIAVPDEAVEKMTTPRGVIEYVNLRLATV